MKSKEKRYIPLIVIAVITFFFSNASSHVLTTIQQMIHIATDTVDVVLENDTNTNKPIVAEDILPVSIRLRNRGAKCFVRWRVELYNGDTFLRPLKEEELQLSKEWMRKKDGYFYRKKGVEETDELDLYQTLYISSDVIKQISIGQKLQVMTTLEAVQIQHFQPDWEQDDPWFGQKIEKTVHMRMEVEE